MDDQVLLDVQTEFCEEPLLVCPEYSSLARAILDEYGICSNPTNFYQALEMYFILVQSVELS